MTGLGVTGECQSPWQMWRRGITVMRDAAWYLRSEPNEWRSSGLKAAVSTKEDTDPTSWPEEPGVGRKTASTGEDCREVVSLGNIPGFRESEERK